MPVLHDMMQDRYRFDAGSHRGWPADGFHAGHAKSSGAPGPLEIRALVERLRYLRQAGCVRLLIGEAIEFLEAHDQRPPFVGIDPVRVAVDEDGRSTKTR